MERYESLGLVGEGSYGTVLKCRHRDSGRLVAIKKFQDSDDDKTVKKIALREIKLLKQLRHDNLVNLLEVWKRRRRWYLVFEFVERTLLDDLEQNPNTLDLNTSRQYLFQILRAVAFIHQQNIIHRDIKPENILISQGGVVKLCDFGFARTMTTPADGGVYTDYVATRWYRAPELLVGDTKYGKPVDVWAVGCLLLEMLTGLPLFPGDSDLDQIYHIVRCFGNLTAHHQELFYRNPVFSGVRLPQCSGRVPLEQRFLTIPTNALDIAKNCLQLDPENRTQCSELLEHTLFTHDSFDVRFLDELNAKIQKDHRENSTLPKIARTQRREKDDRDAKNSRGKDKKQHEEKFNKEKEKGDKEDREDKLPKTKGKQPSKPKSIRNTSEPLMSSKQPKTSGAKIIDSSAKMTKNNHGQMGMRSKAGKTAGAELRREPESSKPPKIYTLDSLEASRTTTDLNDDNAEEAKPKNGKVDSLEPGNGRLVKTTNSTNLHSSCVDNNLSRVAEKSMMEIQMSTKLESSQDSGKNKNISNPRVLKLSKSSTDDTIKSSSPKPSLKSSADPTETDLTQKRSQISTSEYPEGAAAETGERANSDQVQTSFSMQAVEITSSTTSSVVKTYKTTTSSKHHTKCSNVETKQRLTSECPKVLPSSTKPSKITSNSSPKMTKESPSLSSSPLKSLISDLSEHSSEVFVEESQADRTTTQPKGTLRTRSSMDTKPINNTTYATTKPPTDVQTDKDHGEATTATTTQQRSCNTSKEDIKENHQCLTRNPVTKKASQYFETSHEPSSVHQQSTTTESRTKSTSMLDEIPKTRTPVVTTKALKVSDKENREDVALSLSVSPSTKSSLDQISKVEQKEPSLKSLRPLHSFMEEPKTMLGSFSNHTNSPTSVTLKSQKTTEARNKRDNSGRKDSTNVSTISDSTSFTLTSSPDHDAPTRLSHNLHPVDYNEFDFNASSSSPPPPPPPPSSTPLLLPPSSTPLVPFISVGSTNTATSDQFYAGTGFHPGLHDLRGTDKPRHQGAIYSRLTQQPLSGHITGSLRNQVPEKSQICERSFQSDRCNFASTSSVTATKKKSDIHFPDLKSSVLPELKGKEGMHSKHAQKP
ncbi:LOW QUALITY PROTEIN: serine/threonine-protein kinase MAK-like [Notolabrus celidotus]|uniref:LOW QUALITY PROTEIN: serine/threonine-protein kinase MAK-like n=1 Tax=Notolabrus celidotus TaxID=1203425 RepID=UPI00148FBE1F|nr:LOW QUALITY PROTEIN: serine/threonine-protein kinase MAK-like [Notolabrus celidotus]